MSVHREPLFVQRAADAEMPDDRLELGRTGEKLAERLLRKLGYRVLSRNYHCPAGEIDIVALDADTVVFAEVRTRRSEASDDIEEFVNPSKQRQVARVARYYVHQHHAEEHPCRFDVILVIVPPDGRPLIRHIPDAFQPGR